MLLGGSATLTKPAPRLRAFPRSGTPSTAVLIFNRGHTMYNRKPFLPSGSYCKRTALGKEYREVDDYLRLTEDEQEHLFNELTFVNDRREYNDEE